MNRHFEKRNDIDLYPQSSLRHYLHENTNSSAENGKYIITWHVQFNILIWFLMSPILPQPTNLLQTINIHNLNKNSIWWYWYTNSSHPTTPVSSNRNYNFHLIYIQICLFASYLLYLKIVSFFVLVALIWV